MSENIINSYGDLKSRLAKYADDEYREFTVKICPSKRPFLGVRVPQIREVAKQVPSEKIEEFLAERPIGYEEMLARGFLIARLPYDRLLKWFDSQVEYMDDWSTCDTFCSAIGKNIRKNKTDFWEKKLDDLLEDKREFAVRTGLVLLKGCYVEPDYLNVIFDRVENLSSREEYYIKMAIAWLIAECFIKFPTATTGYLAVSNLPTWTFNKAISKICDSYRVDEETKILVKKMRR